MTHSCESPRTLRAALGALLAMLCLPLSAAQAQRYHLINLGERQGLPSASVNDLAQHPDGSIWIATRVGAVRHDGQTFQLVPSPRAYGAPRHVAITPDGRVWSTDQQLGHKLVRHDQQGGEIVPLPPSLETSNARVVELLARADDSLALVTAERGVHLRSAHGLWTQPSDPPQAPIWSACVWEDDLLVAGAGGLSRLRKGRWTHGLLAAAGLPDDVLLGVCVDERGAVWVAADGWVGRIQGAEGTIQEEDASLRLLSLARSEQRGAVLCPDGGGGLWLATRGIILRLDSHDSRFERLGTDQGLLGEGANAILRDLDDNTWIATDRGISRIASLRFRNWDHRDGLLSNEVTALLEHPPGRMVIGHNDGISVLDERGARVLLSAPPGLTQADDTRVLDLLADGRGLLWIAQARGGLNSLTSDGTQRHHSLNSEGLPDFVSGLALAPDGSLWVGTSLGLWRGDEQGFHREDGPPQLASSYIRRVFFIRGEPWLATARHGILHRGTKGWEQIQSPDGGDSDEVFAILGRPDGRVLAGTSAGLVEVRDGKLLPPLEPELATKLPAYFLLDDGHGRIWVGTSQGFDLWDGRELRHHDLAHGLPGLEANRAAAVLDSQGRPWFGTVGGLSSYRAEHDQRLPVPPRLGTPSLDVGGVSRLLDQPLRLGYEDRDLLFRLSATSFLGDGRSIWQVRLDGYDEAWLPAADVTDGRVRYTDLPPGSYRLRARARAAQGPWSAEMVTPSVTVLLPWWRQGWFAVALTATLVSLLFLSVRLLEQRRRSVQLELLVAERTSALASAEQRYREMFDKNGTPQMLVDAGSARIMAANDSALALIGRGADDLQGRRLAEVLNHAEADLMASPPDGGRREFSASLRNGSGERVDLAVQASVYDLLGQRTLHLTALDVTERRRLEAQLQQSQKLESVGRLACGVAHDFNNLLTAVLGHAEQARLELPGGSAARPHLDALAAAALRGSRLTSQLLGFAREQAVEPRVLCPAELVAEWQPMLRQVIPGHVRLETRLDPAVGNVRIDPLQLEQVLLNLVINAVDALPEGGLLTVAASSGTPDGQARAGRPASEWISVSVSDDGPGMEPAVLARALEPFFTTKPVGRGTGLGLATCHGIASQNDGRLELDSTPGAGTSVHLLLPLCRQAATVVIEDDLSPQHQAAHAIQATVLLVEDEDMVREVTLLALRRAGHHVLEASSGAQALALSRAHDGPIDLLLTDVVMPGMSGCALAERLVAERAELAVIYASGYTADTLPDPHLRPGEGELLRKPYRMQELQAAVRRALDGEQLGV